MAVTTEAAQDESKRLARLQSLAVLDSPPEALFDGITRLAADLCATPIALISLVDAERQWFKSSHGLPEVAQTPRALSFCAHAMQHGTLMEVPDAWLDTRFAGNPLVTGAPGIRYYAGMPIVMPSGECLGALCVIDHRPRRLDALQTQALTSLGRLVATALIERERRLELNAGLLQSQRNYRLIVEGQTELISLADEDGRLIFVNLAYARFFGLQPAAMVGRLLTEFVDEADCAAVQAHLRTVARSGAAGSNVNRMVSADGSERWVAWTNRRVPSGMDGALAIHSVGRDITAQKQAEQALAESEGRSRALYASTPAMLHSIDKDGRLIEVSNLWLQKLGYRREDVLGRLSSDFLAPASRARAREFVLPEFFRSGRCADVDFQMVREDGSTLDVRLSAVLERDSSGAPLRSLAVMADMTERRVAADALDETEHLLRLVLDALPFRISYWDAQGRLRFANQEFQREFGRPGLGIFGLPPEAVLGAAWQAQVRACFDAGIRGEAAYFEGAFRRQSDGAERVEELRFAPDRRDGRVHGLFVFSFDVTERRAIELQLAEEQERFRLLVENIPDYAVYMLDREGRVATWNAGAERSNGFRAADVLGQHFRIFFAPEDRAAGVPEQELAQALESRSIQTEGWRVRHDGSRYWTAVMLSPIRDGQRRLVGYAKVTRDLTEQRRQQDVLLRVAELAPCAMLMADPGGRIVLVNAETERVFGYRRDELLGLPIEVLLPPRARAAHADLRNAYLRAATARPMGLGRDLYGLRKNGDEFPVEIGLSPIETQDGIGALAAVYDVTERRRRERETERALAEKETLLREVYHRVKNNLQVVQSLLSLQRQALPEGEARAALGDCAQRVQSMALVHEMLYQSGDLAAVPLRGYAQSLLRRIVQANNTGAWNLKVQIEIPDIETGLDSAIPFGLLLTELATNSLKHAFAGRQEGRICVSLERRSDGDLLTVADDGPGFAAGFDPEAVVNSMGLRLARGLALQLGGQLSCATESGAVASALLKHL